LATLKIFTDEHISSSIVEQLQRRNIEVLRCEDAGMKTSDDNQLLEYAATEGYVLLSMDDDVTRLHMEWLKVGKTHTGIFMRRCHNFTGNRVSAPSFYSVQNGLNSLQTALPH
jgi:predicted nuclease of predicted toxin-antitoxin system